MGESSLKKKTGMGWAWWGLTVVVVVAVIAAALLAMKYSKNRKSSHGAEGGALIPYNSPYTPLPDPSINFTQALGVTLTFFDVQKSGKLPAGQPISWRNDSALQDGQDAGLDLTGGLYDAGDHIKFGLPMAYTGTVLAWAVLEYKQQLEAAGLLPQILDAIQWITDFLIKASQTENAYYFQVGDPQADHVCWVRAEDLGSISRPSYQVNASAPGTLGCRQPSIPDPGSDVAGEASATLAAASLVFRSFNSSYSQTLLDHATQLFDFADTYRGAYSRSLPSVVEFYNSTGYVDELLWASAWLYYATDDSKYLNYVTVTNGARFARWGSTGWFSWDDKLPGVQVLLARALLVNPAPAQPMDATTTTDLKSYKKTADDLMCSLLPDSPTASHNRTKGGMLWISEYNSAQHAVSSAFLTIVYSDYLLASKQNVTCSNRIFTPQRLREFATTQATYLLGSNAMNTSYLVGYGKNFPQFIHHRSASIPSYNHTTCQAGFYYLYVDQPNPNVATGALVGGPFLNDSYTDYRPNHMQNEPTTYNSAALAGLLAGLSSGLGVGVAVPPTFA